MAAKGISKSLRRQISQQASFRCGYCLTPERISGARLEIDHIQPESLGGPTTEQNLWLACHSCNLFKGAQSHGSDPQTGKRVRLFNPRMQSWRHHFSWTENGVLINGLTSCGRATVHALQMNHKEIVSARRRWVSVGWWPPEE